MHLYGLVKALRAKLRGAEHRSPERKRVGQRNRGAWVPHRWHAVGVTGTDPGEVECASHPSQIPARRDEGWGTHADPSPERERARHVKCGVGNVHCGVRTIRAPSASERVKAPALALRARMDDRHRAPDDNDRLRAGGEYRS